LPSVGPSQMGTNDRRPMLQMYGNNQLLAHIDTHWINAGFKRGSHWTGSSCGVHVDVP